MTVTACKLSRKQGSPSRIYLDNNSRVGFDKTVVWNITTDDDTQWESSIYNQARAMAPPNDPLPSIGGQYAIKSNHAANSLLNTDSVYLRELRFAQMPDKLTQWTVTGNYQPLRVSETPGDFIENPLARPSKHWYETESFTEIKTQAWNVKLLSLVDTVREADTLGNIVNSVGRDFDEPIEEQRNRLIYVRQRNVPSLSEIELTHFTYDDTLNQGAFGVYPPMHARFLGVTSGQSQTENNTNYFIEVVRVSLSRTPFTHDVVNRGWAYVSDAHVEGDDLVEWKGTEPVNLDVLTGMKLGDAIMGNSIEYRTREMVSYAGLLPTFH